MHKHAYIFTSFSFHVKIKKKTLIATLPKIKKSNDNSTFI